MSYRKPQDAPSGEPLKKSSDRFIPVAILVGVAVLVLLTGMSLYETHQQRTELNNQMAQMVTALNTKPAAPPQQQQRPSGPDPDKVYTVRTEGASFLGPKEAPITIAEFSDFQ